MGCFQFSFVGIVRIMMDFAMDQFVSFCLSLSCVSIAMDYCVSPTHNALSAGKGIVQSFDIDFTPFLCHL